MINYDCRHYCGDDDCNKCSKQGYFYSCAGCEDYTNFFGFMPNKTKQEGSTDV